MVEGLDGPLDRQMRDLLHWTLWHKDEIQKDSDGKGRIRPRGVLSD